MGRKVEADANYTELLLAILDGKDTQKALLSVGSWGKKSNLAKKLGWLKNNRLITSKKIKVEYFNTFERAGEVIKIKHFRTVKKYALNPSGFLRAVIEKINLKINYTPRVRKLLEEIRKGHDVNEDHHRPDYSLADNVLLKDIVLTALCRMKVENPPSISVIIAGIVQGFANSFDNSTKDARIKDSRRQSALFKPVEVDKKDYTALHKLSFACRNYLKYKTSYGGVEFTIEEAIGVTTVKKT